MAISDKKKCQSLINLVGQEIVAMREGMVRIKALRTKYVAQAVNPAGTPLEGNVTALNTAITNLDTALSAAVLTGLIAAIVPTHQNKALD